MQLYKRETAAAIRSLRLHQITVSECRDALGDAMTRMARRHPEQEIAALYTLMLTNEARMTKEVERRARGTQNYRTVLHRPKQFVTDSADRSASDARLTRMLATRVQGSTRAARQPPIRPWTPERRTDLDRKHNHLDPPEPS